MTTTMESRAIHFSSDTPDLFVTTTYAPSLEPGIGVENLVASAIQVPGWAAVRRAELAGFWRSLPDHIQSDFPPTNRSWLEDDSQFTRSVIELQLEGDVVGPLGLAMDLPHFPIADPFYRVVEYYHQNRRHTSTPRLNDFSLRQVMLYAWALTRFHRVYVGEDQTSRARESLEVAFLQDIPVSHSPGLEGYPEGTSK